MGTPNRAEYELLDISAKRYLVKRKTLQVLMGMGNTKNISNIANMMTDSDLVDAQYRSWKLLIWEYSTGKKRYQMMPGSEVIYL